MFLLWWLCADNYTQPSWVSYVPCPLLRTVFQPVHFAPLDHRRWKNYRDAVVELYPHCSIFNFQGTPVHLRFNLALVRYPQFVCAVQAVGSSVVQTTRFTAVSHLPGFNWALFTWQGARGATSAARMLGWCSGAVESAVRLLHPYDSKISTVLQILLDHNILCFSAENSAFSPVRAQYIVVARKNSCFSQKTIQKNCYFSVCFCAICT